MVLYLHLDYQANSRLGSCINKEKRDEQRN